jgi:hypothetical protein
VDDIRNYVVEQRVQIETKTKFIKKSKILADRVNQVYFFIKQRKKFRFF